MIKVYCQGHTEWVPIHISIAKEGGHSPGCLKAECTSAIWLTVVDFVSFPSLSKHILCLGVCIYSYWQNATS